MTQIKKKTWPKEFQEVLDGKKNVDIRLADFDLKEGDELVLEEYNPETKEYTGRTINKRVYSLTKVSLADFYTPEQMKQFGHWIIELNKQGIKDYQELCKKTAKSFDNKDLEISTWGLGLTGEAGDVAGCIKKTFAHDNDQRAGIKENIGDTMWYLAMICNFFGWDMQQVLEENIAKLEKRFPQGFTTQEAKRDNTRIDWNEGAK